MLMKRSCASILCTYKPVKIRIARICFLRRGAAANILPHIHKSAHIFFLWKQTRLESMHHLLRSSTPDQQTASNVTAFVYAASPELQVSGSPSSHIPEALSFVTNRDIIPQAPPERNNPLSEGVKGTTYLGTWMTGGHPSLSESYTKFERIGGSIPSPVDYIFEDQLSIQDVNHETSEFLDVLDNEALDWTATGTGEPSPVALAAQSGVSMDTREEHDDDIMFASTAASHEETLDSAAEATDVLDFFHAGPLPPLFDFFTSDFAIDDNSAQDASCQTFDCAGMTSEQGSNFNVEEGCEGENLNSFTSVKDAKKQNISLVADTISVSSRAAGCDRSTPTSSNMRDNFKEVPERLQQDIMITAPGPFSEVGECPLSEEYPTASYVNNEERAKAHLLQNNTETQNLVGAKVTVLVEGLAQDGNRCMTKEIVNAYICDMCSRRHATKESLEAHKRRKHNFVDPEKCLTCHHCHLVLANKTNLTRHLKGVHGPDADYECDYCGVRFSSKKTLAEHKERRHGVIPDTYKCRRRRYAPPGSEDSKRRRKPIHKKGPSSAENNESKGGIEEEEDDVPLLQKRVFKCSFCNLVSQHRGNVKRHENIVHKGLKPFDCSGCGKRFGTKDNLKLHKCRT